MLLSLGARTTVLFVSWAHKSDCGPRQGPRLLLGGSSEFDTDGHPELLTLTPEAGPRLLIDYITRRGPLSGLHGIRALLKLTISGLRAIDVRKLAAAE